MVDFLKPLLGALGSIIHTYKQDQLREKKEDELTKSEERFRQLAENIRDVFWVGSPDWQNFEYISPAYRELWGRSPQSLYDNPRSWMDAVVEEDREALQQALEKRIAGDFTDPEFPMYRIIRPEGQMAWIKARAYPIFDATGKPVRIVGVAEDVTENRMAQEGLSNSLREKNLLLKELHHRVKNNLQVISSLLGLQMKKMGDAQIEQALKDSRDRIRSMALVHEALHQTKDFARIDGLRYVRDMVANLRNSYEQISSGIRTEVLGESVQLMIEEAVPFGLLLNELVTNVYKHAFPGGRAGELRIELNREGNLVSLRVADNGVGLPPKLDLESPSTLGLQLVNMLVVQLEGELEVEREEGIAFSISFRLKEGEGKEDG